jgi:S-adenosylmethionine:tRNA ribosyltransferase-isomerase
LTYIRGMDPRKISIHDFKYELPNDQIAHHPLPQRDYSRLLVYKSGDISEDRYFNIANQLPGNSLLVFNNTRVVEARILFTKPTGGQIEVFCLEPDSQYSDITTAMLQKGSVHWNCLIGGASKWKSGQVLSKPFKGGILQARFVQKLETSFIIEMSWTPEQLTFAEVLHAAGLIPLPPYIKRAPEKEDLERYQTIYANEEGSVAAPTAGLHFTERIFQSLEEKNIHSTYVTLHVGAGTFRPVKSDTMEEHDMHAEFIDVTLVQIEELITRSSSNVTAVGTTSLRTLESLYWIGVDLIENEVEIGKDYELGQWFAWDNLNVSVSKTEALEAIKSYLLKNEKDRLITKTRLLIMPGYKFRVVDALITNFHQPQSTLLLLVAAFIGEDWRKVYKYALENQFRFLSYGDGCLLFRKDSW